MLKRIIAQSIRTHLPLPLAPCLPGVYIFALRCLYPGTDKHNLIGYPQALPPEEMAGMRQRDGGGGLEVGVVMCVGGGARALNLSGPL